MLKKINIGISSCLLGERVRYDGGHKLDHYLRDTIGQFVEWAPVCPEVESGLPIPREAMQLVIDTKAPRLITVETGIDHTSTLVKWARKKVNLLRLERLCGFVFKSRSPSCAVHNATVVAQTGAPAGKSSGIFARAFMERFPCVPVEDEDRLHDPRNREGFFERVSVYYRWRELIEQGGSIGSLVTFHSEHKLLMMSHSTRHLRELGKLVADPKKYPRSVLLEKYVQLLMDGLRLQTTVKKHTNVLQHMAGYFKRQLSSGDKTELQKLITQYRKGQVPRIVPITLLAHYVGKYDEPYLRRQHYLHPHPPEFMLRNHVCGFID